MFKWGLFKKDLADMDIPSDLKSQMKTIYSKFSGSDSVVLVMDQLSQTVRDQQKELDENRLLIQELESRLEYSYREKNFQADLLTSMADEIQAPIHTINQLGDWLDQTHLDSSQRAYFNFYRKTGKKLNDLFKSMIEVAQLREGIFQTEPISFQLNQVVREIMQALTLTAQEKGIPLTTNISPDVPQYLIGDIKRLEQILISLVNNAIKFTYEGEVQLLIQKGDENASDCSVNFLVIDSGMGVPESQMDTIFDRLAQGDPDVERNYGGTGLGLYICKCFVEQMGGTIWVKNGKEGGAIFGFSIRFEKGGMAGVEEEMLAIPPLSEPEASEPDEESTEVMEDPDGSGDQGSLEENSDKARLKILVVDDCEDTCRLIAKFLEPGPYDVDLVNDGVAALEKYESCDYDLILMDIQLPFLDGVGATMEIRQRESGNHRPKIPIFALVGNPGEEGEGYHLAGDFDHRLIKPVSKNTLLEAIQSIQPKR